MFIVKSSRGFRTFGGLLENNQQFVVTKKNRQGLYRAKQHPHQRVLTCSLLLLACINVIKACQVFCTSNKSRQFCFSRVLQVRKRRQRLK